jgi:di/tricarboxylate transporter
LAAVVVAYLAFGIVPPSEVYTSIEWPVIILLGAMIPIGAALEQSGGTTVIANGIVGLSEGYAPWVVLTILMIVRILDAHRPQEQPSDPWTRRLSLW